MSKQGWFKSQHSATGGNCVEVSLQPDGGAAVRDSKDLGRGPVLVFTAGEWEAFKAGVRDGEFDA